jgi:hypothetical protein
MCAVEISGASVTINMFFVLVFLPNALRHHLALLGCKQEAAVRATAVFDFGCFSILCSSCAWVLAKPEPLNISLIA